MSYVSQSFFYMELFLYLLSSPQLHFIPVGEISCTFCKITVCNYHGIICLIVCNRTNHFLYCSNPNIPFITLCLNNRLFPPFTKNKICPVIMTVTCEFNTISKMPELNSLIPLKCPSTQLIYFFHCHMKIIQGT